MCFTLGQWDQESVIKVSEAPTRQLKYLELSC